MSKNEQNIFMEDIEVPAIVEEKADIAFSKIRKEGRNIMKERTENHFKAKRNVKSIIAAAVCVAFAAAAVSAGAKIGNRNAELSAMLPNFSITAYAAELNMAQADGSDIVFTDVGIGDGAYTGMLFHIQGDAISEVDISIDKGELYSATIEKTTEDAVYDWLAQGAPDGDDGTHTVVEATPSLEQGEDDADIQNLTLYHCTKGGDEIKEKYDDETYYGFYIPDSIVSEIDGGKDLAAASHEMLDVFNGSTLSITITYSDGSSLSKDYELSTAKLMHDENGVITQEEWTGEEGAFVYGIIAKERK